MSELDLSRNIELTVNRTVDDGTCTGDIASHAPAFLDEDETGAFQIPCHPSAKAEIPGAVDVSLDDDMTADKCRLAAALLKDIFRFVGGPSSFEPFEETHKQPIIFRAQLHRFQPLPV